MATAHYSYRPPDQLKISGSDVADNWRRFKDQWDNYEVAIELSEASSEKRAAVFLTCVGPEAYDVYRAMHFESDEERKKIENVVAGFEAFCIGAVNVTYERYRFNKRTQEAGERFDVFLGEIRRLARACDFGAVEESMVRDRIVVGLKDDATRRKLLQIRDLTLDKAIDVCKASEAAAKQLRVITNAEEIQPLHKATRAPSGRTSGTGTVREQRRETKCKYCDRVHEHRKDACPAYGKTCRRCKGKNHFESACLSTYKKQKPTKRPEVHQLNVDDDELLTLHDGGEDRWYSRLEIDGKKIRFLLDCGATANLIPESMIRAMGRSKELRSTTAKLRMFDGTELLTSGAINLPVKHPRTMKIHQLDFYVATKHEQPLLGFKACRALDLLRVVDENICVVGPPATIDEPTCLTEAVVLQEYPDLLEGVGLLDGDVHLEVDESVQPVQMPLRRVPIGIRDRVESELQRLVSDGIIAQVTEPSKWVSALLVVSKPNGKVRLCIDPRPLNKALKRAHYVIPTVDDILPQLSNVKVMSLCDAKEAFWMLKLDEDSSKLTTFETHMGRFRWLRMPYGLKICPEVFQARMHDALSGLKGVHCIADDVLITGSGDTVAEATVDHNRNLRAFFDRCREKGLKLNRDKLQLNRDTLTFCGHELTRTGIRPDKRKVEAITNMPPPKDKQGVMRLLGMTNYLAKFCPNYSMVTAPIRALLQKDNEFCWRDDIHGEAFENLKRMLTSAPCLAYFDKSKATVVQADSSSLGLGCALLQGGKPVAYASRGLTDTETRYSQIEKELLAVTWAMEKFNYYVYGTMSVTVETDHLPLLAIHKKGLNSAPKRLQRMLLRLQRYNYDLVYRPGTALVVADTLSRAYQPTLPNGCETEMAFYEELAACSETEQIADLKLVASEVTINKLRAAAQADEVYSMLVAQIQAGWPSNAAQLAPELRQYSSYCDELAVCDGLVFKGHRVVVPLGAREDILNRIHSAHTGINACIERARQTVFYPGITSAIKALVARCPVCSKFQNEQQKEPLKPYDVPSRPWEVVGTDIFTFHGQDYLITVDYLSGFFEINRLASKRVKDVVHSLKSDFARHGIPCTLISDNSPFGSQEFAEFANLWEFKHTTISPRYSQSNGRVENAVKTAKRLMAKALDANADPFLSLLEWRNTPSSQLHKSPTEILFGRKTRTRLPIAHSQLMTKAAPEAAAALELAKQRQVQYYNRTALPTERGTLPVGQVVRYKHEADWRKARVNRVLPHRAYELKLEDGSTRRRTSRHIRASKEHFNEQTDDGMNDNTPASHTVTVTQPQPGKQQTLRRSDQPYVTRSGRTVKLPARYKD